MKARPLASERENPRVGRAVVATQSKQLRGIFFEIKYVKIYRISVHQHSTQEIDRTYDLSYKASIKLLDWPVTIVASYCHPGFG